MSKFEDVYSPTFDREPCKQANDRDLLPHKASPAHLCSMNVMPDGELVEQVTISHH